MVQKLDIYNIEIGFSKMLQKVKSNPNLSEKNMENILEFLGQCQVEDLSTHRIRKYLYYLANLADWLKKDFEDTEKRDIEKLVLTLNSKGYADWTKYDYKVVLKRFYKWLKGGNEDYPDEVKWIKTTIRKSNHKLPEDLLTEDEVLKMIDNCKNMRDKAMIALLYESGCRIGELLSLKIKHIQFDKHGARITLPEGKTGSRRIRIISSSPHLTFWLGEHPLNDDQEAPLWVGFGGTNKDEALKYQAVWKMLDGVKKRAEVKKAVNPHNFRHSRATYLANHLTEAQMNDYLGWVQGSDIPATYVHLSGRDTDKALEKLYGIKEEEEDKELTKLMPVECPRCKVSNPPSNKFCGRCSAPLSIEVAMALDDFGTIPKEFLTKLLDDPEFKNMVVSKALELKFV